MEKFNQVPEEIKSIELSYLRTESQKYHHIDGSFIISISELLKFIQDNPEAEYIEANCNGYDTENMWLSLQRYREETDGEFEKRKIEIAAQNKKDRDFEEYKEKRGGKPSDPQAETYWEISLWNDFKNSPEWEEFNSELKRAEQVRIEIDGANPA